jgi:hypothetical protein
LNHALPWFQMSLQPLAVGDRLIEVGEGRSVEVEVLGRRNAGNNTDVARSDQHNEKGVRGAILMPIKRWMPMIGKFASGFRD